jgi:cyclopropane-fatty-acyl-phospholipid synthase
MRHAVDALGLRPGMRVLDMGAGWGCFVEYAGRLGIRVEGITISREQHRFVGELIRRERLPCTITLVDFFDYRPAAPLDAAVFMGTLEHLPDVERVATRLVRHLTPAGRVYADFCAQRSSFQVGAFLRKYLWPGPVAYVDLPRLTHALVRAGFNVHEVGDDTLSYAYTVRDWARALEVRQRALAERFGEATVRAFLVFLWASYHFLTTNRTQAYHLVAGREPRDQGARDEEPRSDPRGS